MYVKNESTGRMNMANNIMKKELIDHKIYSAWQFIQYTEKNIDTVHYCADTINNIVDKMTMTTIRWQQDIFADFVDDVTEDGKRIKRLSVTQENSPVYEIRVAGEKINPWFLFDKLLRDFFQYTMNAFDSMSQVMNAGLLANKEKKIDAVDIQRMMTTFNQQTYSIAFPKMQMWLNKIAQSQEFMYIEAINNRTKHTADIANKLSMGILGSSNTTEIGPFFRKNVQHDQIELSDQLQAILDFLNNSWNEFLTIFQEEYVKDTYTENRKHTISGVRQQKWKDKPDQDLVYAYISADTTFDAMPEALYILLVSEGENEVYAHECPFDTILVTGTNNCDVLGRYCAEDVIGDDCLLHYRKYVKDKMVTGIACIFYAHQENPVFYHKNPYFNIESISDDENFLNRTSIFF